MHAVYYAIVSCFLRFVPSFKFLFIDIGKGGETFSASDRRGSRVYAREGLRPSGFKTCKYEFGGIQCIYNVFP